MNVDNQFGFDQLHCFKVYANEHGNGVINDIILLIGNVF
jgi:hypothetical protein